MTDTAVIPDVTTMSSAPKTRTLRERILSAGSWAMFGYACIQVLRLGSNLIMLLPGSVTAGGVRMGSGSRNTLTEDDSYAIRREVEKKVPFLARLLSSF